MKKVSVLFLLFIVTINLISAQDLVNQLQDDTEQNEAIVRGLIFSAPSILLDVESYEGGFGYKKLNSSKANRIAVDLFYAHNSNIASLYVLYAREYHYKIPLFEKFYISPFTGWFIGGGTIWLQHIIDEDHSTTDVSFPLTVGPHFGAELFLFPFLSVFAEYRIAVDVTANLQRIKSGSETTNDLSMNILVDTRMGNSNKLGVVLYLPDRPAKDQD